MGTYCSVICYHWKQCFDKKPFLDTLLSTKSKFLDKIIITYFDAYEEHLIFMKCGHVIRMYISTGQHCTHTKHKVHIVHSWVPTIFFLFLFGCWNRIGSFIFICKTSFAFSDFRHFELKIGNMDVEILQMKLIMIYESLYIKQNYTPDLYKKIYIFLKLSNFYVPWNQTHILK